MVKQWDSLRYIYLSKTGKGMNFTNTSWVKTAPDSQLDKSHMRSPDTETL